MILLYMFQCLLSFVLWAESRVTGGKCGQGRWRELVPREPQTAQQSQPAARSHLVSPGSCQASPHFKLLLCESQERKAGAGTQAPTHSPVESQAARRNLSQPLLVGESIRREGGGACWQGLPAPALRTQVRRLLINRHSFPLSMGRSRRCQVH